MTYINFNSLDLEQQSNEIFKLRCKYSRLGYIDSNVHMDAKNLMMDVLELAVLISKNVHPIYSRLPVKPITVVILDPLQDNTKPSTFFLSKVPLNEYPKAVWRRRGEQYGPAMVRWNKMVERCSLSTAKGYCNYGGRGILICDAWHYLNSNGRANYTDWLKREMEKENLTEKSIFAVDRRDNDSHYSPENCRLVSFTINNQNTRHNQLSFDQVVSLRQQMALVTKVDRLKAIQQIAKQLEVNVPTVLKAITGHSWSNVNATMPPLEVGGGKKGVSQRFTDEMVVAWRKALGAEKRENRSALLKELASEYGFCEGFVRKHVTGKASSVLNKRVPPVLTKEIITANMLSSFTKQYMKVRKTMTLNKFCIAKAKETGLSRGALYGRFQTTLPEYMWRTKGSKNVNRAAPLTKGN